MNFDRIVADASPESSPTPAGLTGHDLHVYRTEEQLTRSATDFLAAGLQAGQPIVVIATEAHRTAFSAALRERDLDTEAILTGHEATWLDARETLAAFMEGPMPNAELFAATVGSVFERVLRKRDYLIVRGYGEMVDLLWKDGNAEAAHAVERLWNDLASNYAYSLLCGYSIDNFLHTGGAADLRRVCKHHSRVLPIDNEMDRSA
jgi:hypothetical protein